MLPPPPEEDKEEAEGHHYEYYKDEDDEEEDLEPLLLIKITKSTNMNLYLYEALNRYQPARSIVNNNIPELGRIYYVKPDSGFLLIAYPNKDVDTDFEFKYWIGTKEDLPDNENPLGFDTETFIIVTTVILSIVIGGSIILLLYIKSRQNVKVTPG